MTEDRLRQALERVHTELEATERVDDEARALLLQVMGDVARVLERTPPRADQDEETPLGERLEDAARQFEAEHPRLFNALQQFVDTLRGAGI